jgi:hypothetical protein
MTTVKIEGIDAVARMLKDIAPQDGRKLLRQTTHDIAKQVVTDAREIMPRDSGDMARATFAKQEPTQGNTIKSTVRVRGNAFYWRFLEYGDGPDGVEHAMFFKAKEKMLSVIDGQFLDAFAKRLVARLIKG